MTSRLENATNKTREDAPPLVKQVWSFLEKQLELAEGREMTVARFVSAANEVTIGWFWREHAEGELRTRRDHEILKFLSPCWGRDFMAEVFGTKATTKETLLVQYLMMQNRHMTGEENNPKSREEWKKTNGGMPLLTDLCLATRSDPMGIIRGLEEVVT